MRPSLDEHLYERIEGRALGQSGPDDVDLRPGEVLSVTGPNGTGKLTLLRVLAGTLLPRDGTITISGFPSGSGRARALVATA